MPKRPDTESPPLSEAIRKGANAIRKKAKDHVVIGAKRTSKTDLRSMIDRALEVIGDRDEAFRWLGTPVPELGFRTPISLAGTQDGQKAVLDVLGRLEHGVY